ncbi:MAG: hypothetical protein K9G76_10605 [Bacteroidales bacterium]|nr:hypothetical protein [Bacteroidales bacterium]MCF8404219.1 hypothetical protein [Bacteroidales bacterium]
MAKKDKKAKAFILSILIACAIITSAMVFVNIYLQKRVRAEINSQLNHNKNSLYTLHFDWVKINVFSGNLLIKNLKFTPSDSAQNMLKEGLIGKLVYSEIPEFRINNLKVINLLRYKEINISAIAIENIHTKYLLNLNAKQEKQKNTLVLHEAFSEEFRDAKIDRININNAAMEFSSVEKKETSLFSVDSVNIHATLIHIDRHTLEQPIPLSLDELEFSAGNFYINSLKDYKIYAARVDFNVADSALTIDDFRMIPKLSREAFNKSIRYNADLFKINTQKIQLNGLNIIELAYNEIVHIHAIKIYKPEIEIYRDKRLPDAPITRKPLLTGLIHNVPLSFKIDTLTLAEGNIQYFEQTDASEAPGNIFINPLYISAYNITNSEKYKSLNPTLDIDFRGKIMGTSFLNITLNADLNSKSESFNLTGTMEPVNGATFNPMITHLLPVRINSGQFYKTEFNFQANHKASKGTLLLHYSDLHLQVIRNNDKKSGLLSVLANGFIRESNEPGEARYMTGNIDFERKQDKSVVHYIWNSLKSGIISIVSPFADKSRNKKNEKKRKVRETK